MFFVRFGYFGGWRVGYIFIFMDIKCRVVCEGFWFISRERDSRVGGFRFGRAVGWRVFYFGFMFVT